MTMTKTMTMIFLCILPEPVPDGEKKETHPPS